MTVIDANLLIYAYNTSAPQHRAASLWLTELWNGQETIGLPWVTIWAFLRIVTNSRLWDRPRSTKEAFGIVNEWLEQPAVILLEPGARHWKILDSLVTTGEASGPRLTGALLAALAIENSALLASTDHDFSRFPTLRWVNPLKTKY